MVSYDFTGRTAVITGGAGGFGRAIAARLHVSGASVALWDRDAAGVAAAAQLLGERALGLAVDTTEESAVVAAAKAVLKRFDRIDFLINNAGILGPVSNTWEHSAEDFRRVLDVNLTGTFICCRVIVPLMLANTRIRRPASAAISSMSRRYRPRKACRALPPTRRRRQGSSR